MPNVGLLPSLLVFSLTHRSLDRHPHRSFCQFHLTCTCPLLHSDPLTPSHPRIHPRQRLLTQRRWRRMPRPPPQSDTSCLLHSSGAATGALWHWEEGLCGVRADRGGGGGAAEGPDCTAPQKTDRRVSRAAAHRPLVTWRAATHMAEHERRRLCVCVCLCCVWMTSHVAYGGADERSGEGSWWQHAASLLLSDRREREASCSLQQHIRLFISSKWCTFSLFFFFLFYLTVNREQYAPTFLPR